MDAENLILLDISNGALKGSTLPPRVKILGWGDNQSVKGTYRVTDKSVALMEANQRNLGYERVAIDFDHCSVSGTAANKALLKEGQPPLIFGYGRVHPVPGEGIFLEEITWTPLGIQHARNFEDLSPALKDDAGEVSLVHSVALCPNGCVHGLQFFSVDQNKQQTPMAEKFISLALLAGIVGLSADANEADVLSAFKKKLESPAPAKPETTTLSADLTAIVAAAVKPLAEQVTTLSVRLEAGEKTAADAVRTTLVTSFARDGKVPKKADGTAFTSQELTALSVGELQLLAANTPVTVALSARNGQPTEAGGKKYRVKVGDKEVVDLAAIFEDENKAAGLRLE